MKTLYITIIILLFFNISNSQDKEIPKENLFFDINCKNEASSFKIKKVKKLYRISLVTNGDSIVFLSKKKKFFKTYDQTKIISCNKLTKFSIDQYLNIMENKNIYILKNRRKFYHVQEMLFYEKSQD